MKHYVAPLARVVEKESYDIPGTEQKKLPNVMGYASEWAVR